MNSSSQNRHNLACGLRALFCRLGGQFRHPEPDAWFYDEHEWHAHLNGLTGYGLTCNAAILDWIEKTLRCATDRRPHNGQSPAPASPPTAA